MIIKFCKLILISFIKFYRFCISPLLPCCCRFRPTCSEYMIESIKIHGVLCGLFLGIRRILRCHPFGGSGYNPVPPKKASRKS